MERWNGEVSIKPSAKDSTATYCFFCGIFWITLYLIPRAGVPSGLLQPLSRYGLADLPQSLFLLDLVAPGNFLVVITSIISIQLLFSTFLLSWFLLTSHATSFCLLGSINGKIVCLLFLIFGLWYSRLQLWTTLLCCGCLWGEGLEENILGPQIGKLKYLVCSCLNVDIKYTSPSVPLTANVCRGHHSLHILSNIDAQSLLAFLLSLLPIVFLLVGCVWFLKSLFGYSGTSRIQVRLGWIDLTRFRSGWCKEQAGLLSSR
jgi:hypothetical protein